MGDQMENSESRGPTNSKKGVGAEDILGQHSIQTIEFQKLPAGIRNKVQQEFIRVIVDKREGINLYSCSLKGK